MKQRLAFFFALIFICTACAQSSLQKNEAEQPAWEQQKNLAVKDSGQNPTGALAADSGTNAPACSFKFLLAGVEEGTFSRELRAIACEYGKKNAVNIALTAQKTQEQQLLGIMLGSNAPALLLLPGEYLPRLGSAGLLCPLGELFTARQAEFYPAAWQACWKEEKLYGVPYAGEALALFVNDAAARKAGAFKEIPPQTLQELLSLSVWIRQNSNMAGFAGVGAQCEDLTDLFVDFVTRKGGVLFAQAAQQNASEEQQKASMAQAEDTALQVLCLYTALLQTGGTAEGAQNNRARAQEEFLLQRAVMTVGTAGEFLKLKEEKAVSNLRAAPLLAGEKSGGLLAVQALSLANGLSREEEQAATAFARWLLLPEQTERLAAAQQKDAAQEGLFLLPLQREGAAQFYRHFPEYAPFAAEFERAVFVPTHPKWAQLRQNALRPVLWGVVQGNLSPQAGFLEIKRRGNEVLLT